jgi:DNA-binding beta-propeller fold protein YncE
MRNYTRNLTALILLFSIFMYLACCDDCPNCPQQPSEPVSDYNLYIASHGNDKGVYVYNTKERELTDFYALPIDDIRDIAVTADGTKLLYTTHVAYQTDSLFILNIPEMDTFMIKTLGTYIEVSNTGKYIALFGDSLIFLDGNTFEILFTASGRVSVGRFLLDDSKFYSTYTSYSGIDIYDMVGESLYTHLDSMGGDERISGIQLIQPSANGDIIYMRVLFSMYFGGIISYYPEQDSIGISVYVGNGIGEMRITQDGKHVMATDPCPAAAIECTSTYDIISIDPVHDRFLPAVTGLFTISDHEGTTGFNPCYIAMTPDSKYALVTSCIGYGVLALLDITKHEFVDIIVSPDIGEFSVGQIVCQKIQN